MRQSGGGYAPVCLRFNTLDRLLIQNRKQVSIHAKSFYYWCFGRILCVWPCIMRTCIDRDSMQTVSADTSSSVSVKGRICNECHMPVQLVPSPPQPPPPLKGPLGGTPCPPQGGPLWATTPKGPFRRGPLVGVLKDPSGLGGCGQEGRLGLCGGPPLERVSTASEDPLRPSTGDGAAFFQHCAPNPNCLYTLRHAARTGSTAVKSMPLKNPNPRWIQAWEQVARDSGSVTGDNTLESHNILLCDSPTPTPQPLLATELYIRSTRTLYTVDAN